MNFVNRKVVNYVPSPCAESGAITKVDSIYDAVGLKDLRKILVERLAIYIAFQSLTSLEVHMDRYTIYAKERNKAFVTTS